MSENQNFTPRRFNVTTESTIALFDVADSLLDLGAADSARIVADAAFALHRANEEIGCVIGLLKRPQKNRKDLRDWRNDMQGFGWGGGDPTLILPWHPSPLERDAGRAIARAVEDVTTNAV